ncbi:hypothetical protein ACRAKI_22385 [Saccharothrix isguenensis]
MVDFYAEDPSDPMRTVSIAEMLAKASRVEEAVEGPERDESRPLAGVVPSFGVGFFVAFDSVGDALV